MGHSALKSFGIWNYLKSEYELRLILILIESLLYIYNVIVNCSKVVENYLDVFISHVV